MRVIGVDACKKGWVGISSDLRAYFGATIIDLVAAAEQDGSLAVVAVDIPIGLPTTRLRQADVIARGLVGQRRQSVFATPVRAALLAATHAQASAINMQATGKGLSQQSYALRTKILEVDAWVRGNVSTVIEVHPEVCFAMLAERTLEHPKSTWSGVEERRQIFGAAGINLPLDVGSAGQFAAVDDVLDAAAASWSALRYANGEAASFPSPPEEMPEGLAAAIWA